MATLNVSQLQNGEAEQDSDGALIQYIMMWKSRQIRFTTKIPGGFIYFFACLFVSRREEASGDLFTQSLPQWHTQRQRERNWNIYSYEVHTEIHHKQNLLVLSYEIQSSELINQRSRHHAHSSPSILSWIQISLSIRQKKHTQKTEDNLHSTIVKNPNVYVKCD